MIKPPQVGTDPLGRAKTLAEKMARVLDGESVSEVTVALALLTSGAIHQHADDVGKARQLIQAVHHLEGRFLKTVFGAGLELQ